MPKTVTSESEPIHTNNQKFWKAACFYQLLHPSNNCEKGNIETYLRVVLPLPVSPTIISVSFFLTSSTSLFSTEATTDNKIQLPELTPPKNIIVDRLSLLPNQLPPSAQANPQKHLYIFLVYKFRMHTISWVKRLYKRGYQTLIVSSVFEYKLIS